MNSEISHESTRVCEETSRNINIHSPCTVTNDILCDDNNFENLQSNVNERNLKTTQKESNCIVLDDTPSNSDSSQLMNSVHFLQKKLRTKLFSPMTMLKVKQAQEQNSSSWIILT